MAKVRLITSEPRIVPWLDRTVEPDEVVTVRDEQFESYVCQPAVWQAVEEPKAAKAAPSKRAGSKDGE